jgi:Ca2+-transporting ATPase
METQPVMASASVDADGLPPYAREAADVIAGMGSDATSGLTGAEAAARLSRYGPNEISKEKPPSMSAVAAQQLRDPMNIMLVAVVGVSFVIGEVSTGVIVALLILLNVVLGTRQELKARASIDALSNLQVPQAKVVRDGSVMLVPAVDLVPGDIVEVEAGDIVPADGRIIHSATLETQEAALTGESAPVGKDAVALAGSDVGLGDRSNMLFQNTAVTRGTAAIIVTATGMGRRENDPLNVTRTSPPKELLEVPGSWGAAPAAARPRREVRDVLLLGGAAISAIPTGSRPVSAPLEGANSSPRHASPHGGLTACFTPEPTTTTKSPARSSLGGAPRFAALGAIRAATRHVRHVCSINVA